MKNYPSISSLEMASTSDGGYVLCSNLTVFKIDSEGNTLWTKDLHLFPESSNALELSLIQTLDGGYAILGGGSFDISDDQPMGIGKVWIIKTDPDGIIPEFSSWTILPLVLAAIVVVIVYRKKLYRTQTQQS